MTTDLFSHQQVPFEILAKRAFNYRWAETEAGVIPLTAADPDFPVAQEIRDAICGYAHSGVFSYGPPRGLKEFREAIAKGFADRKQINISADHVLAIDSAASGMYAVSRAFLQAGDEMIIFDPVDFLFEQSVLAVGARVVRCPFDIEQNSFRLDLLEKLLSSKTRMIGVCNPHNPLGRLMKPGELELIAKFAIEHDLWILNDEIWSDIVYPDHTFFSLNHLREELRKKTITVYGFSKAFGLAGLRVGAIIAPDERTYQVLLEASHVMTTAGGVSTLSQIAAIAAVEQCWYWVDQFVQHLNHLRKIAVTRLRAMPGITCTKPEATYLLFPDVTGTRLGAEQLVEYLEKNALVKLIPGNEQFFGPGAVGHIRLCFATSETLLVEALDRIETSMNEIHGAHS